MAETGLVFRRGSGSRVKDKEMLGVSEDVVSLQNRRENALIITFKAPEEEAMNIHQFFDNFDELEPVFVDIAGAGDVEYYFRGISPINELDESDREFSVTLQLRREFV